MDAGKYYALLRFEEASLALRVALKLGIVDRIANRELDLDEFRDLFGFTHQGARTYAALLEVMEVLVRSGRTFRVAPRAAETLADSLPTSRKPYLTLGSGDEVDVLIDQLRGKFPSDSLPLYGGDDVAQTVMDMPEVAQEIALGLASRARNFAEPLARAIQPFSNKATIMADIGAGSPYVAQACLDAMPRLNKAILVDRANGMRFARKIAAELGRDSKLEFLEQDFFQSVPPADIYVISNTAHDWRGEEYVTLLTNVRDSIAPGGVVCIHEPLLRAEWNSAEQWVSALWMACYALSLYKLTEGQGTCYTRDEHDSIASRCGFLPVDEPIETSDGCTAMFYKLKGDVLSSPPKETARQMAANR